MNLHDLILRAAADTLSHSDLESASQQMRISPHHLCDAFARTVAEGYLDGKYSWEIGDAAMNQLYGLAYVFSDMGLPEFAWRVFEAFDAGEYLHGPEPTEFDGEPRTRALLVALLHPVA